MKYLVMMCLLSGCASVSVRSYNKVSTTICGEGTKAEFLAQALEQCTKVTGIEGVYTRYWEQNSGLGPEWDTILKYHQEKCVVYSCRK